MARSKKQEQRGDYVPHGSDRHASMLMLRKAEKHDDQDLVIDGWTLADLTAYGPNATDRFLKNVLAGKVKELNAAPETPQSEDPFAPNYAPPMFDPDSLRREAARA